MIAKERWQVKTIAVLDQVFSERLRLADEELISSADEDPRQLIESGQLLRAAALLVERLEQES